MQATEVFVPGAFPQHIISSARSKVLSKCYATRSGLLVKSFHYLGLQSQAKLCWSSASLGVTT